MEEEQWVGSSPCKPRSMAAASGLHWLSIFLLVLLFGGRNELVVTTLTDAKNCGLGRSVDGVDWLV